AEIVEHAPRLLGDPAADHLSRRRIERHLARDEQELAGANRLRVRPDRLRRAVAGDALLRHDATCRTRVALRRFRHLAAAQAPRADADALNPAVDNRTHELQVRLEPPRAHVVRVAVLPADHRSLAANLTSLRHVCTLRETDKRQLYQRRRYGRINRGASPASGPGAASASGRRMITRVRKSRNARGFAASAAPASRAVSTARRSTTAASPSNALPPPSPACARIGFSRFTSRSAGSDAGRCS